MLRQSESNFEDQNKNIKPSEQITNSTPHVQEIHLSDTNDELDEDTSSTPDFSNLTTDAGDNPFITNPPPIDDLDYQNESSPISIGYNPRKVADYNLRPNPTPKTKLDFRRLDALDITRNIKQISESRLNQPDGFQI